ncbi:MAG: sulfurtransferase TusA family protein [Planctomycetaceae bacterium TMED241]|jgi:TusA-related sulfurtransferase|uniref:sulfurtransferase TusA family protein n=1 Tax=Synechococcales TaxID=1890424 RepID=UPI000031A780|nr:MULTISPECIES: sulfurtransferase TusA family protein [unclassified Synechococcus]MBL6740045.1 sulfurtransferase TusA family protein [Synechococcus sp. BS301-5m-G54]MBL6795188.1 sulfurtransferase TusA family protein [Synechococcus sp. BS307-5m-G34]OUW68609.1 MAG: SirA family protein [Synechococcus sp. TMED205]RCL55847.1 MAG: sulfurtransferase TusA family protein [Synechococcus sp. MED-G70]RPG10629.1 MAG: sulfurtransferase TusA family protein [Planctomycetaceae bacterium TMED241]HCX52840.1 su|tara:strand:- start:441 stop:668 length:228 start_codon:yes stop_codon:yes gene_type:complete
MSSGSLDLRGTPCPVNFIRCRLALEALQPGDLLNVQLDRGEPEEMVIPGLREAGHRVEITDDSSSWIVLRVVCGG